ncbi:protein Apa1p [Monosporozyma unispora]|nr:bifunctional AP-4-A phosphorylase/ADP sulfurylase [Kazachstania unispora]
MLTDNIKQLIEDKYIEAYNNKSLIFNDVETFIKINCYNGMMYWIRFAPSLLAKPEKGDTPINHDPLGKHEPELLVLQNMDPLEKEFKLVLNKFPVMPNHTLLITNPYKDQRTSLTPQDLIKCYTLLKTMNTTQDEKNFIIYNSGPASGSSQNHKHLQLLQFPNGFIPFQDKLCNNKNPFIPTKGLEPLQDKFVSFAHFVIPLPSSPTQDDLMDCYIALLQYILPFFNNWNNPTIHPSYNVILTENWMCLVPRSNIRAKSLPVGFNSIGYTGLIMIKQEDTLNQIKNNPDLIDGLLLECGFPNPAKIQ